MTGQLDRRKSLGGTAAAVAGTAAMSGEAAARYVGQPIFTTDYIYIREGPGTDYLPTCDTYTGLEIAAGRTGRWRRTPKSGGAPASNG